uniref:RRM domain-containing protein n=1 Tax=Bionectria ochroleuca TaxID=29856 RepID=A0A8H7TU81_BIOOC
MKSKRAREATEGEAPAREELPEGPTKKRKRDGEDASTGKKSKKDKKHKQESRKERKDKRKDLIDLPEEEPEEEGDDALQAENDAKPEATAGGQAEEAKEVKEKKDKKKEKKEKKDKKDKKDKKEKKTKEKGEPADETAEAAADGENPNNIEVDANKKADRHIVFVGNLPFSATVATITAHFASLSPISVRCLKNKGDDKPCRGIAFVEFGKVWHMRTCLDKFHHSMFEDGVSPARRINVELTAGGGGKNKNRHDKIREKNLKLDENRSKRIEKEKVAKEENRQSGDHNMEDAIHPSRRARVPDNRW